MFNYLLKFMIFVFIIHGTCATNSTTKQQQNPNKSRDVELLDEKKFKYCIIKRKEQTLICENFISFTELDFRNNNDTFMKIIIKPFKSVQLDNSLNLTGLKMAQMGGIQFYNIKSFSYDQNPLLTLKVEGKPKVQSIRITDSDFLFTHTTGLLSSQCNEENLNPQSLFATVTSVYLENVRIASTICALVFMNASLTSMDIDSMQNNDDSFRFIDIKYNKSSNLTVTTKIDFFRIKSSTINSLDTSVLPVQLFSKTKEIGFTNCTIGYITDDAFKMLPNLKFLTFTNMSNGFNNLILVQNSWIFNLNYNMTVNETNRNEILKLLPDWKKTSVFVLFVKGLNTQFSNDDICSFKNYPHNRLLFNSFVPNNGSLKCTCTALWMQKIQLKFTSEIKHKTLYIKNFFNDNTMECASLNETRLSALYNSCDFENTFKKCKNNNDNKRDYLLNDGQKNSIKYSYAVSDINSNKPNKNKKAFILSGLAIVGLLIIICGVILFKRYKRSRRNLNVGLLDEDREGYVQMRNLNE